MMNQPQVVPCDHCRTRTTSNVRYVACGSTSLWHKNNDDPSITTKDDIKIWKVALCDSCIPSAYKIFLINRMKGQLWMLGISSFTFAMAAALIYLYFLPDMSGKGLLQCLYAALIGLCLIIGVVGIPASLIGLVISSVRLQNLTSRGLVSEKDKDKSYIGEGERIIKWGETGGTSKNMNEFPLPKFKGLKDLQLTDKERKQIINKEYGSVRTMNIIAVAPTLEELETALPPEWKTLLKSSIQAP